MNDGGPAALGMVLATLVDGRGKPVRGGAGKGQLYAGPEGLVVLKQTSAQELFQRVTTTALVVSVAIVVANLFLWKNLLAIWVAIALQAVYWLSLSRRRHALEPEPLGAAAFAGAARTRTLLRVPADRIVSTVPPEPTRPGRFRKPARFVLSDGALEVYLSEDQFREAIAALGRSG